MASTPPLAGGSKWLQNSGCLPHHHLPFPLSWYTHSVAITVLRPWGLLSLLTSVTIGSQRPSLILTLSSKQHSVVKLLKSLCGFPYSLHYSPQLLKPFDWALWKSLSSAKFPISSISFGMFFSFPYILFGDMSIHVFCQLLLNLESFLHILALSHLQDICFEKFFFCPWLISSSPQFK